MKLHIALLVMGILTQNFVLSKFLGISPFMEKTDSLKEAVRVSLALFPVMLLSTAVTYPLNIILNKLSVQFLGTLVYIIAVVATASVLIVITKKLSESTYEKHKDLIPFIMTNCAVLGLVLLNSRNADAFADFGFFHSLTFALAASAGFLLAMVLFTGVKSKIDSDYLPECLRGTPITLISASVVSLAFSGFAGLAENIGLI